MAYERVEPYGSDRIHDLLAMIATILAAVNRKKGTPAPSLEDFLPWRRRGAPRPPARAVAMETDLKSALLRAGKRKKP